MQFYLKIPSKNNYLYEKNSYLNPTAACQTNTNKKKNKGISGRTSTVGAKAL